MVMPSSISSPHAKDVSNVSSAVRTPPMLPQVMLWLSLAAPCRCGVVHVDVKTVGTVVREGQLVGVSNICCALANPVRVDLDRRCNVRLNMKRKNRSTNTSPKQQQGRCFVGGSWVEGGAAPLQDFG